MEKIILQSRTKPVQKRRLFIAILLPRNIRLELNGISKRLSSESPELKYEKEEKLHLTLKFLGWTDISPERISEVLQRTVLNAAPFSLRFANLGFFFSSNFILFADLEKSEPLFNLVSKIEEEMKRLGFPKEKRPFKSHITLARGKRKPISFWREIAQKISQKKFPLPESFSVSEIVLMESILEREGSRYKILANLLF